MKMKKICKSFTFVFLILSIIIITFNLMGMDDKNLMLIGLNPIIMNIVYDEPFRSIIWSDGPTIYMYILHLFTYMIYGGVIDIIVCFIKKLKKR